MAFKIKDCRDEERHKDEKKQCDIHYITHEGSHGIKTD